MLKSKKIVYLILGFIFFIAVLFRFVNLHAYPAGFHIDEASLGYNGYSLLLTGRDDNGNFFPLYVDMFGDNRPSGYHYLTVIPIIFFGLTEFATRFPGALFGSLTIFAVYYLAQTIFKKKAIGLISAFLIAVSPWHIILSRASNEAVVALFFIISGFALLLLGLAENRNKFILWGAILTPVSYFFYHTPRIFVPFAFLLFVIYLFPFWKKEVKTPRFKIGSIFILLTSLAFCLVFLVKGGTGRYSQVNIFNNFQTDFFIGQERQEDSLAHAPAYLSRAVHNKITNSWRVFLSNYLSYFSEEFLFTKGGLPIWYGVPRIGLMYVIEFPLLLLGLYFLFENKDKMRKIPILWLIIAPVVSAITIDDIPNVNRSIVMIPALTLIVAAGLYKLTELYKRKKALIIPVIGLLFFVNIFYFSYQYFVNATVHNNGYRNNGFSEMMKIVNENYHKYDLIVISKYQGGIYPLVLFYSKYDPATYQKEGSLKSKDYGGFGKFFFVPQDCPSVQRADSLPKVDSILFIDKGSCAASGALENKKILYINREDGGRAFRIVYD